MTRKQRAAIRALLRGDLCRAYTAGEPATIAPVFCKTCGRTEMVHLLRVLYEALVTLEKVK